MLKDYDEMKKIANSHGKKEAQFMGYCTIKYLTKSTRPIEERMEAISQIVDALEEIKKDPTIPEVIQNDNPPFMVEGI